ncbi:MAG: TetR/AcrR family transcriptional regulator [Kordiimonadaceae bacterium]|nr:TetR/AcrR family transcriptional regulator [Kordiimonadaceae bacterium]
MSATSLHHETIQPRPTRGRPRDDSKSKAILEAASELFLELGFDGTSMDGVARRAGVSKQTVYSHYSSKEQLFGEAVRGAIATYYPDKALASVDSHTLEGDLKAVCHMLASLLMDDRAIAMFRLLVAAGAKGSAMGEIFWKSGPADIQVQLANFLTTWVDRGELDIQDTEKAGQQLVALVKEPAHFRIAIGIQQPLDEAGIEECVNDAVASFLRMYGKA